MPLTIARIDAMPPTPPGMRSVKTPIARLINDPRRVFPQPNRVLVAVDEVAAVQDTDPGDHVHEIDALLRLEIEEDEDSRHEPEDERDEAERPLLAAHRRAEGALLSKPCE